MAQSKAALDAELAAAQQTLKANKGYEKAAAIAIRELKANKGYEKAAAKAIREQNAERPAEGKPKLTRDEEDAIRVTFKKAYTDVAARKRRDRRVSDLSNGSMEKTARPVTPLAEPSSGTI